MAAGRVYHAQFTKVSVSAAQDLVLIEAPSTMAIEIISVRISPVDQLAATEILSIAQRKFASGYTAGSGGSTITPTKLLKGDAASVCTVLTNNTTPTTGTIEDSIDDAWNEVNGYLDVAVPDTEMTVEPSGAFVLALLTAPGGTRLVSGTVTYREIL